MADAHVVSIGLFNVNSVGSVIDKSNPISAQMPFTTEHRIIPKSSIANSQNHPSLATYLQLEAADGYILTHIDQYIVVTIYGGNGLDGHRTIETVDASTTLTTDQDIILVTATSTITLPTTNYHTIIGQRKTYTIKNWATDIVVTVAAAAGETIDGTATVVLDQHYHSITIVSDGADWAIIGRV